jgi:dephospho-CoA kinase
LARVLSRPGWTEEIWKSREKSQLPLTDKQAMADHVINNSGGFESLRSQVQAIVKELSLEPLANHPHG